MYQSNPLPKQALPTMYDLPSEEIGDSGLPDQYHSLQAQILEHTFYPANYPLDQVFCAIDLNLYYDVRHPTWYKRPDWFGVVGVDRLYDKYDLRMSYVIWQEEVSPFIVVELLSPGTEKEDLGQTLRDADQPPPKWEVYQNILKIPYYVVFDRYSDQLRIFELRENLYQQLSLPDSRIWFDAIGLGIGLWQGTYLGITRQWLRWYDAAGNWIPIPEEVAQREKQRAEAEKQRADRLEAQLRALGIKPEV